MLRMRAEARSDARFDMGLFIVAPNPCQMRDLTWVWRYDELVMLNLASALERAVRTPLRAPWLVTRRFCRKTELGVGSAIHRAGRCPVRLRRWCIYHDCSGCKVGQRPARR